MIVTYFGPTRAQWNITRKSEFAFEQFHIGELTGEIHIYVHMYMLKYVRSLLSRSIVEFSFNSTVAKGELCFWGS